MKTSERIEDERNREREMAYERGKADQHKEDEKEIARLGHLIANNYSKDEQDYMEEIKKLNEHIKLLADSHEGVEANKDAWKADCEAKEKEIKELKDKLELFEKETTDGAEILLWAEACEDVDKDIIKMVLKSVKKLKDGEKISMAVLAQDMQEIKNKLKQQLSQSQQDMIEKVDNYFYDGDLVMIMGEDDWEAIKQSLKDKKVKE